MHFYAFSYNYQKYSVDADIPSLSSNSVNYIYTGYFITVFTKYQERQSTPRGWENAEQCMIGNIFLSQS